MTGYPIAVAAATGLALGVLLLPIHRAAAHTVFAAVAVGGGVPLAWATLRNMLRGRFHVDTIATLAIIGSIALGEYLAGALVVLMQSGGEALEDYGLRRANRSLDNLLRRAPSVAHRRCGDEFEDVPAADLQIGDTILVRPGDIIAADGVVLEGQGSVDEAALTGEPVPLPKLPGDRVFSGTINLTGSFLVRTTNTAAKRSPVRADRTDGAARSGRAGADQPARQPVYSRVHPADARDRRRGPLVDRRHGPGAGGARGRDTLPAHHRHAARRTLRDQPGGVPEHHCEEWRGHRAGRAGQDRRLR